jgi:cell division protein FtsQ
MPVMLDEEVTVLEIDGDRLVMSGVTSVVAAGSTGEANYLPSDYLDMETRRAPLQREVPIRRIIAASTVSNGVGVTSKAHHSDTNHAGTNEDPRFVDRRQAVAIDAYNARRRRRSRIVIALMVIIGAAIVIGSSPIFRVHQIEVVGLKGLSRETLLSAAAIEDQPSMLVLKTAEVERRLATVPLVQNVKVWKAWPNRLVIEVTERFAVATVRSPQGWAVLDQLGGTIEHRPVRPDLPRIEISPDSSAGGPANGGSNANDPTVMQLLQVANASSPLLRQQIDQLSMHPDGVSITLRDGVIQNPDLSIHFGHVDDVDAKLRALATMLDPATKAKFQGFLTLDLTVADQPALLASTVLPPAPVDGHATNSPLVSPLVSPVVSTQSIPISVVSNGPGSVDATLEPVPGSNLVQ